MNDRSRHQWDEGAARHAKPDNNKRFSVVLKDYTGGFVASGGDVAWVEVVVRDSLVQFFNNRATRSVV